MEETINKLIKETWEAHTEVLNLSLELLLGKLDDLDVKADFMENPTLVSNETIQKVELKAKELSKEEQEPTDKLEERAEVKKNVVNILKGSKSQQIKRKHKKNDDTLIRVNGLFHCPECSYTTQWRRKTLRVHINAVHRKLRTWECSDCTKNFLSKGHLSEHKLNKHNTNKNWICDCCGSRFGMKNALKIHMMIHLPPSFFCSECDKKFVYAWDLKNHNKLHQGILTEFCKLCNKGFATKGGLRNHIILNHFAKFNCGVTECSSVLSSKSNYKYHLKTVHKKYDKVSIENLLVNLEKLKPNFQKYKYM